MEGTPPANLNAYQQQSPEYSYFFDRVEQLRPKWQRIQQLSRDLGIVRNANVVHVDYGCQQG